MTARMGHWSDTVSRSPDTSWSRSGYALLSGASMALCSSNTARRDVDELLTRYGYRRHEANLAWTPTYLWSLPPS